MKPRVGIGITTYKDISEPDIGAAIFDAYTSHLAPLTPVQLEIRSKKYPIKARDDFQRHWLTLIPFEVHERKGGQRLEAGNYRVGPHWRSKSGGGGHAVFRPEMQGDSDDCILIDHQWEPELNWFSFFTDLIAICAPSHAMLHLFEHAKDNTPIQGHDGIATFAGPFAGEHNFTMWRAESGHWYRPDRWQLAQRRQYRFLPQLSWANFLGPEFQGQYDVSSIEKHAASFRSQHNGVFFTVTEKLEEVTYLPGEFEMRRLALREAFQPSFFRI